MAVRRTYDRSRFADAASRPGIDPRLWVSQARVIELGFDSESGIFADIEYIPTGEPDTALIGLPYAGDGFGDWCPIEVGDLVYVEMPNGDPDSGPIITGRAFNKFDRPPADMKAEQQEDGSDVPTQNRVIRIKPGRKLVIRTSDDNGDVDIKVEGNGKATIDAAGFGDVQINQSGSGLVILGDGGNAQFMFRGEELRNWIIAQIQTKLNSFMTGIYNSHTHTGAFTGSTAPPVPLATETIDAPPNLSQKVKNS